MPGNPYVSVTQTSSGIFLVEQIKGNFGVNLIGRGEIPGTSEWFRTARNLDFTTTETCVIAG